MSASREWDCPAGRRRWPAPSARGLGAYLGDKKEEGRCRQTHDEGEQIAPALGMDLCAVLCGDGVDILAAELIAYGADKVYLLRSKGYSGVE